MPDSSAAGNGPRPSGRSRPTTIVDRRGRRGCSALLFQAVGNHEVSARQSRPSWPAWPSAVEATDAVEAAEADEDDDAHEDAVEAIQAAGNRVGCVSRASDAIGRH